MFVNLGVPDTPLSIRAYSLLANRRSIAGSSCGGMPETQEMIDFCAEHGVGAQVEVIDAGYVNEAYDRLVAGDVRYRFVIDARTFASREGRGREQRRRSTDASFGREARGSSWRDGSTAGDGERAAES